MKQIAEIIFAVADTSGTIDKQNILKRYEATPGLKEILKFIYNPYCKTGISNTKLTNAMRGWDTWSTGSHRVVEWPEALKYFSTHQTGTLHDLAFAKEFILTCETHYGPQAKKLARAIVTQDLKIGVSVTTLNKIFGADFIPKTGCMLGTLYGDVGPAKTQWPCIVTEKLDGVRRILIKENGVCRMYSRSGHEDTGLVEIIEEAQDLPDNYVYDGELLAIGQFKDSIQLRQATNSIANSKGIKTGLDFNVFDMVPLEDFYRGVSKDPAIRRKLRLGATLMDESIQVLNDDWWKMIQAFGIHKKLKFIRPVPILGLVHCMEDASPIVEEIWMHGGEGIMLNTAEGKYEIKRSKSLLKVKHTEEHVLKVVDMVEGTGKYEDCLGSLIVEYKGSRVGVGSGFTDEMRVTLWNYPEKVIGSMIEVECFGESTNQQGLVSLNCPIFKRFVGED